LKWHSRLIPTNEEVVMTQQTIACTLTDTELRTRGERWLRLGDEASGCVAETDEGLRVTFRFSRHAEEELRALAELERECCAFATWTVSTDSEDLFLDVKGRGDAVPVIHGMFREYPRET
jgi:hypothetical protein